MNAFERTSRVEQRSLKILRPFIQQRAFNGQYVVTAKGPLARELQKSVGDVLFNSDSDTVYSIEIKAEEENANGNFFLETWSNLSRFTPGWMFTLRADLLLYHFLREDQVYKIPFNRLRLWAFKDKRIYTYPEKPQGKYAQANDTWGRCVKIGDLSKELNLPPPFHPLQEAVGYDAADDMSKSVSECLRAVRERKAAGGPGWPNEE